MKIQRKYILGKMNFFQKGKRNSFFFFEKKIILFPKKKENTFNFGKKGKNTFKYAKNIFLQKNKSFQKEVHL